MRYILMWKWQEARGGMTCIQAPRFRRKTVLDTGRDKVLASEPVVGALWERRQRGAIIGAWA